MLKMSNVCIVENGGKRLHVAKENLWHKIYVLMNLGKCVNGDVKLFDRFFFLFVFIK